MAYKIKLPQTSRIHPVFHISLVKKVVGNYSVQLELPTSLEGDNEIQWEPIAVLATRGI